MPPTSRRVRPWQVVAAVLVVVVVVLGIVHARSKRGGPAASPSGPVASSAATLPPQAAALPLGVTFGDALFLASEREVEHALDEVVALHLTWIRVDISWADIQPLTAARFDWGRMDRIVAAAHERRLRVLGLLSYTPEWAAADGCVVSFTCPPRSATEFARYAKAVVTRYAPRGVTTYQVWNEPNIALFWNNPDPDAYGRLLTASVTAMRAAAPNLRILFGGLAFSTEGGSDIAPSRFLADTCSGRVCDVDAIGYDPFTYPNLPSDSSRPLNAWQLLSNPAAGRLGIRAAAEQAGLGDKPIWVTEFGAPTEYDGGSDRRLVSEAQQAKIVVDGLQLARQESAYVGGYFVDTLQDARAGGTTRDHFGLVASDGRQKPAFAALAAAVRSQR